MTSSEKKSSMSIAILLASNGADLHALNQKQQTPLDLCPDPNLLKLLTKCYNDFLTSQKGASLQVSIGEAASDKGEGLKQCMVCSESPRDTLLGPCGHILTCSVCVTRITRCLSCKEEITTRTKVSQTLVHSTE